jgi:excisionase family DNA binding protein
VKKTAQNPAIPEGQYTSAEYLADKYNVSARYILKLAAEGRIPSLRLGRKCVRFSPEAVAAAIGDTK